MKALMGKLMADGGRIHCYRDAVGLYIGYQPIWQIVQRLYSYRMLDQVELIETPPDVFPCPFFDVDTILKVDQEIIKKKTVVKIKNEEIAQECSVCADSLIGDGETLVTPAGHVYHKGCIEDWLKERQIDPNTGQKLTKEELQPCTLEVED